jgi:large subunit ribosomal protein L1
MSLAALGALSRGCARAPLAPLLAGAASPARAFSSTPAASFRRQPKGRKEISKKARDAKDRRREAARPKSVYEREKMPLSEAIAVLRVRARPAACSCPF